ncbi:hypothetical protein [Kribbella sp. NPDC004536]|uniref:hypothetical protein n=1 Tax=Kribbella sp. NPDC004536 TaxID=3364106 RepID=UPI003675ED94
MTSAGVTSGAELDGEVHAFGGDELAFAVDVAGLVRGVLESDEGEAQVGGPAGVEGFGQPEVEDVRAPADLDHLRDDGIAVGLHEHPAQAGLGIAFEGVRESPYAGGGGADAAPEVDAVHGPV